MIKAVLSLLEKQNESIKEASSEKNAGKMVTIEIYLLNFFGRSKCVTEWQFLLIF